MGAVEETAPESVSAEHPYVIITFRLLTLAQCLFWSASLRETDLRQCSRSLPKRNHFMLTNSGFSHVGLSTHQMDATIQFYQGVLGFPHVLEDLTHVQAGGTLRMVYFDVGDGQFMVFMEPKSVPGIPADYDTGINSALGVPRGMYHFAFKVASLDDLESRRRSLESQGIDVSATIDLRYAKAIFFFDPNGIQLEFCCQIRPFNESDLHQQSEVSVASSS